MMDNRVNISTYLLKLVTRFDFTFSYLIQQLSQTTFISKLMLWAQDW